MSIQSLNSTQLEAIRQAVKNIDKICIEGQRVVNNAWQKSNSERFYNLANEKLMPSNLYHFIFRDVEIYGEYDSIKGYSVRILKKEAYKKDDKIVIEVDNFEAMKQEFLERVSFVVGNEICV